VAWIASRAHASLDGKALFCNEIRENRGAPQIFSKSCERVGRATPEFRAEGITATCVIGLSNPLGQRGVDGLFVLRDGDSLFQIGEIASAASVPLPRRR
jgi:hypothetical protein